MTRSRLLVRGSFVILLLAGLLVGILAPTFAPVRAAPQQAVAPGDVVISEFRTSGPNGGNDEFIEFFNRSGGDVDLSGWTVNGSNNAGPTSPARYTFPANTILAPGKHYLIANTSANGYNGTVTPDGTFSQGITATGGIALVNLSNVIIDQVGMSASPSYVEGTPLAPLSGNLDQSYERKPGGISGSYQDTDNNQNDFSLKTPSDPQNKASAPIYSTGVPTFTPTPTNIPSLTPMPTACLGTTFVQWSFDGTSTPSIGFGTFSEGTGLTGPTFDTGWTSASGDQAASFTGWTTLPSSDPNDYIEFDVSTLGRASISTPLSISFVYRSTSTGPTKLDASYSADGTTYSVFSPANLLQNNSNWYPLTFDLSTLAGQLNNKPNAKFRFYAYSAGNSSAGKLTLDEVAFSGSCINPAPTPTNTSSPHKPTPIPPTPFAHVVINEFLPRAGFDWNNDGLIDTNDEFIEIENLGPINVNLSGWRLSDDPNIGGKTFSLPNQTLQPGQRAVYYGSTTHILLVDSGDTIRLTNSYGVIVDARGYGVVKYPDQSHCRIPDGDGYWRTNCFPTPGTENKLTGVIPFTPPLKINQTAPCLLPDTTPAEFRLAVCNPFGADISNNKYWDDMAGQKQFVIPDPFSKGLVILK